MVITWLTWSNWLRLNDSRLNVMGKGNLKIEIEGHVQVFTNVYYIPELRSNLLSTGQLQQRLYLWMISARFSIEIRVCWWPPTWQTTKCLLEGVHLLFLQVTNEDVTDLWHRRYGYLSYKGLRLLKHAGRNGERAAHAWWNKECVLKMSGWEASQRYYVKNIPIGEH